MKKSKILWAVIALLAAIAVFVIGSCGDGDPDNPEEPPAGSKAEITAIKIGEMEIRPARLVSRETLEDDGFRGMASINTTTYLREHWYNVPTDITDVSVEVTASPGAKVKLAIATNSSTQLKALLDPDEEIDRFEPVDEESTFTFAANRVVWFQVTNGKIVNYYRVQLLAKSATAQLSSFTINEIVIPIQQGDGNPVWASVKSSAVILEGLPMTRASLDTEAAAKGTVRFAKYSDTFGSEAAPLPDDFTNNPVMDLAAGNWIAIEVSSENGQNKRYYKFEIRSDVRPWLPGTDYTMPGGPWKNATKASGTTQYYNILNVDLVFPEGFEIKNFTQYTVGANIYNVEDDNTPIGSGYGNAEIRWIWSDGSASGTQYNLGQTTDHASFSGMDAGGWAPEDAPDSNPDTLRVQTSALGIGYIEITEITFHL